MSLEQDRPPFERATSALVNKYINSFPEGDKRQRYFPAKGREKVVFEDTEYFYRHSIENEEGIPVLTYHHLGNAWVAIESAAKILGIKTFASYKRGIYSSAPIAPSPITPEDKALGAKYMPEQMCGPIYATSGYFMSRQAEFEDLKSYAKKEKGAEENMEPSEGGDELPTGENPNETIPTALEETPEEGEEDDKHRLIYFTHISHSTCKEREYARFEEAALSDRYAEGTNGTPFDFYGVLETSEGLRKMIKFLAKLGHTDEYQAVMAVNAGIQRARAAEALDRITLWEQSMMEGSDIMKESDINRAEGFLNQAKNELASNLDLSPEAIVVEYSGKIKDLPKRMVKVVKEGKLVEEEATEPKGKILVTGEIFHCAEIASSSYNLARLLVESGFYPYMDVGLGHYLDKFELTLGGIAKQILQGINPIKRDHRKSQAAKVGLKKNPGGHAEDIASAIAEIEQLDYDGIIVLSPHLCAPNIVVRNVTIHHVNKPSKPNVNKSSKPAFKPTRHIDISDQTADTRIKTEIEAFLYSIETKKQQAAKLALGLNGQL